MSLRLLASDAPAEMVLIPAGSFQMGNALSETGDGFDDELPVHSVYVSAFYMGRTEVTKALWDEVYTWAIAHGYSFDNAGSGRAANYPVHGVTWYDMLKWCNARSEREGRTPEYYTSAAQTAVYRTNQVDVLNDWVRWEAGYRLPTEAEWEKAARGGASGRRFPWSDSDTIQHTRANYRSDDRRIYDTSATRGYHPEYTDIVYPYTSPVGAFAPNGYGLYDMAGNVTERCWDRWGSSYYGVAPSSDPRGPTSGAVRVMRGGGWHTVPNICRVADRYRFVLPDYRDANIGFRLVRAAP